MPYVPPNGSAVELDLAGDYRAPGGASINLEFDPSTAADVRQATVAASGAVVGTPQVIGTPLAKARGFNASAFGRVSIGTDTPKIAPAGIDSTITVGTPEYVRWPKYADPSSINPPIWPLGTLRIRLMGGYNPPPGESLILNWFVEPYAPPPATSLQLDFGALGYGYVWPAMGNVSALGSPTVAAPDGLRPAGIAPPPINAPNIQTSINELRVSGFLSVEHGLPYLQNTGVALKPAGWDAVAGLAGVGAGYAVRTLRPAGLYSTPFGLPALAQPPSLAPEGIVGALGEPTVWPRVRWVQASGAAAQAFGDATTWFRLRSVATAGEDAQAHGDTMVSHGRRWLLSEGAQFARAGEPTVSNADRTISPASIYTNFATGHALGWQRALSPVGFNAARFGARIIPEIQQAYPQGFAGQHGLATIFNFRKVVIPPSIRTGLQPADRWGTARAWNLRQYISMAYDPDSGLNPQAWAKWTKIENRNRIVGALGGVATRLGDAQVDNAARPLQPIGVPAPAHPETYKSGLVAYRVRHIQTEGVMPPYMSRWATAWNSAVLVGPQGLDAPLWGRPAVVNTRRYFNRIGGFDAAWCGYPMVAPRVRTVSIESRYGIAPPYIRAPEVRLYTRYIDAIGYEPAKVGWASLSIHWTIITPRWTLQNLYGSPMVRNVTPELRTRGRASDAFGDAFVRLEWRPVAHAGAMTQLFGRTIIAFRDRTVPVASIRAGAFGDKLTVVKTGAPPYSTQAITLARFADDGGYIDGFGIPIPGDGSDRDAPEQVSAPTLNQQVVYVLQEDSATRFGMASITANTIRVEPGYWELSVGDPMISLKNRVLKVPPFPESKIYEPEKPRVSPHTIWASVEAPSQAIDNHPSPWVLHYVDQIPASERWKKGIGNPSVALQHRAIQQFFDPETWRLPGYGTPTVQLRRNYITPTGFRAQRMGWHEIPGLRILEQFESEDQADFGAARVEHVVTVWPLLVQQLDALEVGAPQIELLHRVVSAQGYEAMRMGDAKPGDTPYMWQGLRVGPLMPTIPEGFEADLHGEQWISHRVRELHAEGFDDFRAEYQLERFDQRMRVTRRTTPTIPPARRIFAAGVHPAVASGAPDIQPGVHFIRPDGNAEQFRKGAF